MTFAEPVTTYRTARHISHRQLAATTSMSVRAIRDLERGSTNRPAGWPSADDAIRRLLGAAERLQEILLECLGLLCTNMERYFDRLARTANGPSAHLLYESRRYLVHRCQRVGADAGVSQARLVYHLRTNPALRAHLRQVTDIAALVALVDVVADFCDTETPLAESRHC